MSNKQITFDTEKIVEKVYSIKELHKILEDVIVDYVNETRLKSDDELNYDRSDWMKKFGKPDENNLDNAEDIYDADIQSLAIMIEQLRRYGGIKYKREGRVNEKNLPKP